MRSIPAHITNYTTGRTRAVDHIVVHYTGNDGDTAEGNGKYFSASGREASAHYFVDERETVQSVAEGDTAWHAGDWVMNCRSIGVEMCSRKDSRGQYYIPDATFANAQALVRALMAKYGIDADHVVRHYDVTRKVCPEPFVRKPELWANFKAGLKKAASSAPKPSEPSAWAREACLWARERGVVLGDETGDCRWQEPVTKEQLALMLYRALQ